MDQPGPPGVRKTYKYKLQPTPAQERELERVLLLCRTLYNTALEQRLTAWQRCQISVSRYQQEAELKTIRAELPEYATMLMEALGVMPDRVHLFVAAPPTDAPQHLAKQFKGYALRVLWQECMDARTRLPTLWSSSYDVGSAGQVFEETTTRDLASQKERS